MHTQVTMLPHMFAANRFNYARWMPTYILDMADLPPDIKSAFEGGQFSFCETPGAFNGLWSDVGVEKTGIRMQGFQE